MPKTHDQFGPVLGRTVPAAAVPEPYRWCAENGCAIRVDSTTRRYCERHRVEHVIASNARSRGAFA